MNNKQEFRQGNITKFIINGTDFFSAYTDNDEIRIGLVGCDSVVNIPKGHLRYSEAALIDTEDGIEALFDEMIDLFLKAIFANSKR